MKEEGVVDYVDRAFSQYHYEILVATLGDTYDLPPDCHKRFDHFLVAGREFKPEDPSATKHFAYMGREELTEFSPVLMARVNLLACRDTDISEGFRMMRFPVKPASAHPLARQWKSVSFFARVDRSKFYSSISVTSNVSPQQRPQTLR